MSDRNPETKAFGRVAAVALVLGLIFVLLVLANNQWDPLTFATIGEKFDRANLEDSDWYDGRWFYYIARYPSSAEPYLDAPAYRYQRIVYPITAWLLSLGGAPNVVPWTLIAINLLAIAGLAGVLAQLLTSQHASGWFALLVPLSIGGLFVLRGDMSELLALALALLGLRLVSRERLMLAAVIFALGGLTKETALLFAAAVALWLFTQRRWRMGITLAIISAGPLIIWMVIAALWHKESGFATNRTAFELLPFYGLLFTKPIEAAFMLLLWVVGPTTVMLVAAGRHLLRNSSATSPDRVSLFAWCVIINGLFLAFGPRASYVDVLAMMRLLLGLMASSLLLVAGTSRRRLVWLLAIWTPTILLAGMIPGFIITP